MRTDIYIHRGVQDADLGSLGGCLESALGTEGYYNLMRELEPLPSKDVMAFAKSFCRSSAGSKAGALKDIYNKNKQIMVQMARGAAVRGRSAG